MQLVEAGKIELDAPVQRYLPWFRVADPQASAQMTVRHLLNQTSGLPTVAWSELALADFDDRPDATERQVRALSTLKLTRPVGSKCEYSNLNYNILGLIVEAASGESYADYIQNHIFNPLEMRHSYTSKAEAKQNGLAMGHRHWFSLPFPAPNLPIPHGSLPSGQLISSAEDMAHYLIAHLNGGRYWRRRANPLERRHRRAAPRGGGINDAGRLVGAVRHGMVRDRYRPNENLLARRQRSRFFCLYGARSGAEERRGPAPQRRPLWIASHHGRGWDGCDSLARRPAARSDPAGLYPVDHASPAADPASPDRRRLRHPAVVTPLAPGSCSFARAVDACGGSISCFR